MISATDTTPGGSLLPMTDSRLFGVMIPLSRLFNFDRVKEVRGNIKAYKDYLIDLKIRLYQHGATGAEDWVVVGLKYGTFKPIYIERELGEHLKDPSARGDYYSFKTSRADIDIILKNLSRYE